MSEMTPEGMTPEAAAAQKAREDEYGVYVATEAIDIGGARAFNRGDPVPVSHVTNNVVRADQVVKRDTKAGKSVTGQEG